MEITIILIDQIFKMLLMMLVGYGAYKLHIIDDNNTKELSTFLLMVITPFTIFNAFLIEYSSDKLIMIFIMLLLSIFCIGVGVILCKLILKDNEKIQRFAIIFSNVGFMGIPLVNAICGQDYLIYLSIYIITFNILTWTYGVYFMSDGKEKINIKNIISNPIIISVFIGFIFFIFRIPIASQIRYVSNGFASCNTFIAMFILGAYLAKDKLLNLFISLSCYKVSFYRLLVVPIIVVVFFILIPDEYTKLKLTALLASCTPSGVFSPIFAQRYNEDYVASSNMVSLSTLLSLITIPFIVSIALNIW